MPPTFSPSKGGRGADCSDSSVLFFLELSTRKVEIAGIAPVANGLWMKQIGRNLTDAVDGVLKGKRFLIHDRDPLFTDEFLKVLKETGVASVKLPVRSPNLNAYAERSYARSRSRDWSD